MSDVPSPALRIRKSLLFTPGDSMHKIQNAARLDADSIIMDLEDSVTPVRKATARQTVAEALRSVDFGGRERLICINPVGSDLSAMDLADVDLEATVSAQPDGYIVPKVEDAAHLQHVDQYLTDVERRNDWPLLSIRLFALIETARGLMNLREIGGSSSRLDALIFGAEDLAGDMGATRTRAGLEILYARSAVVTAAVAFGLQAIDTVFVDLADQEGLREDCVRVQQMGYLGKLAIHPQQLGVINGVFSPSSEDVAAAQRIVQAYETQQAEGVGAFQLDGRLIYLPMVRAARRILARAEQS